MKRCYLFALSGLAVMLATSFMTSAFAAVPTTKSVTLMALSLVNTDVTVAAVIAIKAVAEQSFDTSTQKPALQRPIDGDFKFLKTAYLNSVGARRHPYHLRC